MFNNSFPKILLFLLIAMVLTFKAFSFGPPFWADPFVKSFCPQNNTLASKEDKWIAIYSEVEFSISSEGYLIKTKRFLLENISTKDEIFNGFIPFNPSQEEIKEIELKIQSKYRWKKINISQAGGKINDSHKGSLVLIAGEPIPPRNKVVWEYSIIDKMNLMCWSYEYLFEAFPILEKKIFISDEAKKLGYTLELVDNFPTEPAENFKTISDSSYLTKNIPSIDKIPFTKTDPFCSYCVYPHFVFFKKGTEEQLEYFSKKYLEKWDLSFTEESKKAISELAQSLTFSKPTLKEKILSIADYVQFNIAYDSSFEKGEFGLIPLSPLEIIRSKRADCKGKVLLAQKLLEAIGVKSQIVLLRYLNIYCPNNQKEISQAHFNHVVLAVDFKAFDKNDAELISGPGKGLIVFDPTSITTRFGESPPGVEGMTGFMPHQHSQGFFEIHLKKPSVWLCHAKVDVEYDSNKNMNLKINLIDNGLSLFMMLFKEHRNEEEVKKEILKLYSNLSPSVKIIKIEINEPPSKNIWEASIEMKIEKPYYELQKSSLYLNPLAVLLVGFSLFPEEIEENTIDKTFTLSAPWNRRLNANCCEKNLLIDLSVKFYDHPLFVLPNSFSFHNEWLNTSVDWSRENGINYKANAKISLPRGKWETEKLEEKRSDYAKIKGIFTSPIKSL